MTVQHESTTQRFTIAAPSGIAHLLYASAGPGLIEYYSTFVPPADRGQGIASKLVAAAVAHARAERLRIIPSCWYVAQWLSAHPEHTDLIAD